MTTATTSSNIFSMELSPEALKPLQLPQYITNKQSTASNQLNPGNYSSNTIIHGNYDCKRQRCLTGKAVIPTYQLQLIAANNHSTNTIPTINNSVVRKDHHQPTMSITQAPTTTSRTASVFKTKDIKCVSKTKAGKYILIAVVDSIPSPGRTAGRPSKIHHKRNDSFADLVKFICKHKSISLYDGNHKSWQEHANDSNKKLLQSQRDILNLTTTVLSTLSNGNIGQLLWSFINSRKHIAVKQHIQHQIEMQQQTPMRKLLGNISRCVDDTVDHAKYEWCMPLVATFSSYDEANKCGLDIGSRPWRRASKLFAQTGDVTATTTKGHKVSMFVYVCIVFADLG